MHILLDELFLKLAAAMVDGVPNLLNVEIPSEKVKSLLATDNLPTVTNYPQLVYKAILKKEQREQHFPQLNHHLDIAPGNNNLHGNTMIVSPALHFSENYGTASWEPTAYAQGFLPNVCSNIPPTKNR